LGHLRSLCYAVCCAVLLAAGLVRADEHPTGAEVTSKMVTVGDHRLSARLYVPAVARYPLVVLMPGSGNESVLGSRNTQALASAFVRHGIAVLAYDKRGVGESSGASTGSDFAALGEDGAAVLRYAAALPHVQQVGLWGISQAGWVAPFAVRRVGPLAFVQLVSPAGVNPFEQVAYFLRLQAAGWGLSPTQVEQADSMHRAVALYYAGRADYASAQAAVDACKSEPWFRKVVTHPYWDEMTPDGRVLTPHQLARAVTERPGDFEIYRSASSFEDYASAYRSLELPTLIVYGGADQLVPVARSHEVFEAAFAGDASRLHDFRMYEHASHEIAGSDGTVLADYLEVLATWARARFDEAR